MYVSHVRCAVPLAHNRKAIMTVSLLKPIVLDSYGNRVIPHMFATMRSIRDACASPAHGVDWFGPKERRVFGSRWTDDVYAGCIFISSERMPDSGQPRRYTVRWASEDGAVGTIGSFRQYPSLGTARTATRNYADILNGK